MLFSFKAGLVEFFDLGVSNFNEDTGEKFFFFKMVHMTATHPAGRDVFLLAIHSDQVKKWDHCLNLREPDFEDQIFNEILESVR